MKRNPIAANVRQNVPARLGTALSLMASLAVLAAPAAAQKLSADVKLYNTTGNPVGKVRLTQEGSGTVSVQAQVHDLPPGFHGFHVHAVGECVPPFTSAGGHFDQDAHTHRDHSGDFPVLLVNADGTATARFNTDRFSVADLFDADGSAVIVHAGPDNYANIPTRYAAAPDATTLATGDAGARIACGVVDKVVGKD
ncbi:superoxide dismutase family protein [Noviherbaspirillum sp. ST9]|uniref:superoxide dismutase family protein n=1 Tax=Noviherbaspirillum sp. ST9 TaxID=3401606 RepID=UPI003B587ACF